MADKTTNITITAARRPRAPAKSRAREVRHGAFTRIEDDPLAPPDSPPVLVVTMFDAGFSLQTKTYSVKTPALPSQPKAAPFWFAGLVARAKTIAFPNAQGYAFADLGELTALNLSRPRAPRSTSSFVPGYGGWSVVEEGVLYLIAPAKITAVDVSDPAAIALTHEYNAVSDFTARQRWMGVPAVLNKRLYVASEPNLGGASGGDGADSYLATYNFDDPAAAIQISVITLATGGGVQNQQPPVVLGAGVLYVSFQYRDAVSPFNTYTTRLKTYTLADPDAPSEVSSIDVVASGAVVGFAVPAYALDRLWINKSKTRLFLLTLGQPVAGVYMGALRMYDVSTPTAPALLDSVAVEFPGAFERIEGYVTDSGFVYVGTFTPTPAIEVYSIAGDVFTLATTVVIPSPAQALLVYALDAKGFPQ